MQKGAAPTLSEPPTQFGRRLQRRPEGFALDRVAGLRPSCVIDFPELEVRRKPDDMSDIHDVRRQPGYDVHAVQGEALLTVEVDEVAVKVH